MLGAALVVVLTLGLAFANGANDVSKGVATLVGSSLGSVRGSLAWGAAWTAAGALAAGFISPGLVAVFSGSVLLAAPPAGWTFPASVAAGAIGWLGVATRAGLPVSTTHALVGGLVGTGLVAGGFGGVSWVSVADKVALPLALSPLLALVLVSVIFPVVATSFRRWSRYCVCLERHELALAPTGAGPQLTTGRALQVVVGADCPPAVITRVNALDSLHWLSAGLTSFARALNDAPKILALSLVGASVLGLGAGPLVALMALAMGAGSHLAGRRVTDTLAAKVTRIPPDDGLAANLVTASLVALASAVAVPVSTTHVSMGAIAGIGVRQRDLRWKLVRELLLAWVVTVPAAAALAALTYGGLSW